MRIQCADVKKVLGSVHKMNLGGNVVVLDGDKLHAEQGDWQENQDQLRAGAVRDARVGAGEGECSQGGVGESFEGQQVRDFGRGV